MKIQIPTNCPCCQYPLERVVDQLFCKNLACPAQLSKKVEHFCKVLGIKGMGEKTIQKLNLSDITELFYLDPMEVTNSLGSKKVAEKLLDEIERSKSASLATVLASFSIPLIGETASKKVANVVSSIDEISPEVCKTAGLGEKATLNLMNWIETEYSELKEFLPFNFDTVDEKVSEDAETICITGKLKSFKTKADAYEILGKAGYRVVESVTKTTTYLVDEEDKNSSKRQTADKYGVKIITNLIDFLR